MAPLDALRAQEQLLDRRRKLETLAQRTRGAGEIDRLLREVDAALARVDAGTWGICLTCHDPVETERLEADPLLQFCLDHLSPHEQRFLEQDLDLAVRIQKALLPERALSWEGWEAAWHYEPAGPVSGDYCDWIPSRDRVHFAVGDVSGKGVSAALLMSQIHALFRTLVPLGLPLEEILARASRTLCEATLPSSYATVILGRADRSGEIELVNAGHPPALLLRATRIEPVPSSGPPIGLFCDGNFSVTRTTLAPGETVLLYTDGVTEAPDPAGGEYGAERLGRVAGRVAGGDPPALVRACVGDLAGFRGGARRHDDVTLMAVRRSV